MTTKRGDFAFLANDVEWFADSDMSEPAKSIDTKSGSVPNTDA